MEMYTEYMVWHIDTMQDCVTTFPIFLVCRAPKMHRWSTPVGARGTRCAGTERAATGSRPLLQHRWGQALSH